MKILRKIWEDILHGENIDLYLTIIIGVSLSILTILGITPVDWLQPLTLAVLALLAISNLNVRQKLESLANNQLNRSFFLKKYPPTLENDLNDAREIWLIGQNLSRTTITFAPMLANKLTKGCKMKILLIEPDGMANKLISASDYLQVENDKSHREKILSTLSTFSQLKRIKTGKLELRVIDYLLPFGCWAINLNTLKGKIYLEQYSFRTENDLPKTVLTIDDGEWYELYKGQILALWDVATPWQDSLNR